MEVGGCGEEVKDHGVEEVGDATEGEEICEGEVGQDVLVDFCGEDSHRQKALSIDRETGLKGLEGGREGTRLLLDLGDRSRDKAAFHPNQSSGSKGRRDLSP